MNHDPEIDQEAYDDLDDFDSNPFADLDDADHGYIGRLWDRHGFRSGGTVSESDVIVAHGMVQSFLNSFSRNGRYTISFHEGVGAAGTETATRRVVLTPAPILDESISAEEAGRVLTGLAVHEISHPRYGKDTKRAVIAVFPGSNAAAVMSNLLDDVRIERRFVEDYPGYAGIFAPTIDYIGRQQATKRGGRLVPRREDPINTAIAAIRYEKFADWDGLEGERDWWKAWADRWAAYDSPRRHVDAIREALRHVAAVRARVAAEKEAQEQARQKEEATQVRVGDDAPETDDEADGDGGRAEPDEDGDEGDEDGASGGYADDDDEDDPDAEDDDAGAYGGAGADPADDDEPGEPAGSPGEPADDDHDDGDDGAADDEDDDEPDDDELAGEMTDEELGDAADEDLGQTPPTCAGTDEVEQAAVGAGVDPTEIRDAADEAEKAIEDAEFHESDGHGRVVDVARSMKRLIRSQYVNRRSSRFVKSDVAARYIRDALLRSRTGHTEVSHYQKRGRIDQQGLHRITQNDYRLFDRRRAESPGRFLVWMLLDRSSSMDGQPSIQAAQVATAIADASRHVKTVRAAVWAWSESFRNSYDYSPGVALAWRTGAPTRDIADVIDLPSGGTPDAEIMGWASLAILKELRGSEQPVIVMCSDGWGDENLGARVAEARKRGITVISVAFGSLDEKTQLDRFGRDGYVAWQGDIISTSRPLAKMIARIVGRDQRRRY